MHAYMYGEYNGDVSHSQRHTHAHTHFTKHTNKQTGIMWAVSVEWVLLLKCKHHWVSITPERNQINCFITIIYWFLMKLLKILLEQKIRVYFWLHASDSEYHQIYVIKGWSNQRHLVLAMQNSRFLCLAWHRTILCLCFMSNNTIHWLISNRYTHVFWSRTEQQDKKKFSTFIFAVKVL